jgi:hypothetical protein
MADVAPFLFIVLSAQPDPPGSSRGRTFVLESEMLTSRPFYAAAASSKPAAQVFGRGSEPQGFGPRQMLTSAIQLPAVFLRCDEFVHGSQSDYRSSSPSPSRDMTSTNNLLPKKPN